MDVTEKRSTRKRPVGLRIRVTLVFFIIGALLSGAITFSTYRIMTGELIQQLKVRVGDLAKIGALSIDRTAMRRLADEAQTGMPPSAVRKVEGSPDFRLISEELNSIREADPRLIHYVYTFVPTKDGEIARFVVDADVLPRIRFPADGSRVASDEVSHFASTFNIAGFPVAQEALREHRPLVEDAFTYDPTFKVNSISGYAPIFDTDGRTMIAVLGLDMVDSDVRASLNRTTSTSLLVGVVALLLALGASILFATLFSRRVLDLERVVRRFSTHDLAVRFDVRSGDEIGRLGSSFNEMADTIERSSTQLESLLSAYGRFVPHDFLRFLGKESVLDVALGDQIQREMTILFSDIRGFTELSEAMSPRENFNFINSYLSRMGPEIRAHGGFIDKYIGDGIMALFPDEPDDAVQAAVAMQERLREYNRHRHSVGYRAVEIGIGIHTGSLMLGTIGEAERMDGSVIADAVNLCSRLEALTRIYGSTVLISGQTLSLTREQNAYRHRFVDRVRVRGRSEAVLIYELFEGDEEEQRVLKSVTREDWNRALNLYYYRDFEESYKILSEIRAQNPRDPVVDLYMARCVRLIHDGVPSDWQGVELIDLK
ncbi:MAG TPA: adenylate/guanylate cyclase domain-containing protein [Spirochaetia bacterium]|nr:adenylate/guanylate cyclase domain-containing protein [Spirochaetia bacterium]